MAGTTYDGSSPTPMPPMTCWRPRFTPGYLVRESSEGCGPGFLDQAGPVPCDQFVHEFNDGLPPGSYDIWAEWWAPCAAWTVAEACDDVDRPLPLFGGKVPDIPMYHDTYTPADHFVGQEGFDGLWSFDPWESQQP